jgi:hypothetical protein
MSRTPATVFGELALDRQARPFGQRLFSIPNGPFRLFPSHPPPVVAEIITTADAAGGSTRAHWGTSLMKRGKIPMIEVRGLTKRYGEKVA